jgi:hypothetical protein
LNQVRKKLISDKPSTSRTANYLKYAIGEIVLVVIGILIALSINNANEKRKARVQEITILKNFQEDILLDTLDISFNIEKHKEFIRNEKRLLHFLRSNHKQPKDSINFSSALSFPLTIALHKSTFNNLQNNQIGILTNNRLKKDISRFYDFFAQAISKIENEKPVYETYSSKKVFFQKYFKLTSATYTVNSDQTNNEDYYNPSLTKEDMEFKDIEGAKNDEAFKIELNESIFIRNAKIDFYINMINRIKELNEEINKELEVLSK